MRGCRTLWEMGSDNAGSATEMVVGRDLALEGKGETSDSLGREKFIEKVCEWKAQSGDTIERQMRRIGTSGDWSRSVFTMDPMASNAVIEAFVRLHEQGLVYRGKRLVNWDQIGRASCRERVCQYVSISVVAVSLKQQKITKLIHVKYNKH